MHALGLTSRFIPRRLRKPHSFASRVHSSRHALQGRYLFLPIAILAICVSSPRAACATIISTRSHANVVMTMNIASGQQFSCPAHKVELRRLTPLGGLPMFLGVLLWFPETENMSDVQVVAVQSEPSHRRSRSYRWLRIGMLILFAMGLLGMLFS